MSLHTSASGVLREIVQPYAGYGNVVRRLSTVTAGIGGVNREIFGTHRWEKWSIKQVESAIVSAPYKKNIHKGARDIVSLYRGYRILNNVVDHVYFECGTGNKPQKGMLAEDWAYGVGQPLKEYNYSADVVFGGRRGNSLYHILDAKFLDDENTTVVLSAEITEATWMTTPEKDQLLGTIESTNPNAYPQNGVHTDGYWYVRI